MELSHRFLTWFWLDSECSKRGAVSAYTKASSCPGLNVNTESFTAKYQNLSISSSPKNGDTVGCRPLSRRRLAAAQPSLDPVICTGKSSSFLFLHFELHFVFCLRDFMGMESAGKCHILRCCSPLVTFMPGGCGTPCSECSRLQLRPADQASMDMDISNFIPVIWIPYLSELSTARTH